jgi:signal transduction histidine kinase/CheY-like chemotaxis protein
MPQLVFAAAHETINAQGSGKHWYNDAWYEYSGAPKEVTSTESWGKYIHPDDFPEAVRLWLDAVEREKLWDFPLRLRRHDGVYRWFQGRALPIRDSSTHKATKWFGTLTDINDQQESLAASRRAQNQLESVINHADVTIWAVDREGIITIAKGPGVKQLKLTTSSTSSGSEKESNDGQCHGEVNKRPHLQTRTSSNSHSNRAIIGRSIYDVWDSTNNIRKALAGESLIEETEIDGRWFRTSYKPMRAQPDEIYSLAGELQSEKDSEVNVVEGEIIGVVGASLDITERKTAQAKMERSMLDKTSALAAEQAAKEASRLKSEFLANMSHEIRTPIAGVIGLSELMLDESGLTNQLRDYAETIRRSAEGLLNVINDVLDFSKVEIGKLDVEKEPFNLDTLLVDAKRMLTFATEKKGLDFKESYNLSYKGLIVGDVGRLKQVLINLLTNAIKFTSRGFVSLEVTEVSEDADKLLLGFDIRDTGCGISKESLARLFQPFSQADPSTARRFGGTGLGLSISKNLVELMGGQIGLDSIEGQGSHAWFRIPMIKAKEVEEEDDNYTVTDKKDEVADETLESHIIERPRGDIWILIAEDNEVNARIAFKNVEKMGFKCRIAENGLLALQELAKRKYDLVLMDCQMPECDGYEATKLMRTSADANIRSLPVIALTASAINGDRERALDAGMVDYLSKPVMRTALETSLCKWLFDQQARQALLKYNRVGLSSPKSGRGAPFMDVGSPTRRKSAAVVKWSENVQVEGTTQAVSPSLVSPSSAADNREAWKEDSRHDPFADHLNVNASESIFTTMARTLSSDQIPGQSKFTNDFVRRPALSKRSQSHGPPSSPSKTIINNNKSNDNDDRL